ncbi:MAG: DUF2851 family protein [Marinifilaceae bacterium]|jgi:hypothetical protein|nr:DUF2851 family protein [Marinifilaceae bacterium]
MEKNTSITAKIKEDFLHFIWKQELFLNKEFITGKGERIEIVDVGKHNHSSGPDFADAKVMISGTLWCGNVEIHIKSSHWNQHKHYNNPAYNNVILHVVLEDDVDVFTNSNRLLPNFVLSIDGNYIDKYVELMESESWVPCSDSISQINNFFVKSWISRLSIERLMDKSGQIKQLLVKNKNNWESTFYQLVAQYFGSDLNSQAFLMLAKSLPLNILARHKNSFMSIEALLFGQAGFLNENIDDKYYSQLRSEYRFLKRKYSLNSLLPEMWKWGRLRPSNFPHIRVAQFANLIFKSNKLFSKILELESVSKIIPLFESEASEYWNTHYRFGKESKYKKKILGLNTINSLLINSVFPILQYYSNFYGKPLMSERVIGFLENLPAENNSVIRSWSSVGIIAKTAFQTQALLQLKYNYCNSYRCVECELGNRIIRLKSDTN